MRHFLHVSYSSLVHALDITTCGYLFLKEFCIYSRYHTKDIGTVVIAVFRGTRRHNSDSKLVIARLVVIIVAITNIVCLPTWDSCTPSHFLLGFPVQLNFPMRCERAC